jgi:hypothetical protein
MNEKIFEKETLFHLILLFIIWLIAAVIINPIGEFPFGDDWSFSKPVKYFCETGQIKLTGWSSMTLLAHLFWGIGITEIFGFSHSALRISIVFLGFLGLIAYYFLLNQFIKEKKLCFVLVLLFGFNPVFTLHSYSFYTDVSFFTVFIWCLFVFVKFLDSNKKYYLAISLLLLSIAFLIRDIALIAVPAFILAMFYKDKLNRKTILYSIILLVVSVSVYFAYRYWITHVHGLPMNQDFIRERLLTTLTNPSQLIKEYIENSYMTLLTLGFYLFPFILILFLNEYKSFTKHIKVISLILIFSFVIGLIAITNTFPKLFIKSSEMVLGTLGINEVIERVNPARLFQLSKNAKLIFITIGFLGMSILMILILKRILTFKKIIKQNRIDYKFILIISIIIIYLAVIFTQNLFTRYLIPIYALFPIFLLFTNESETLNLKSRKEQIIYGLLLVFYLYLGVSNPRDNLEFNRHRWQATDYLLSEYKLTPEEIDGGFEFTAWHYYVPVYISPPGKNWWWVIGDDYSVAPGYIEGYDIIKVFTFRRFFPPCYQDSVFASKKKSLLND